MSKEFTGFDEFYPFYLEEHSHPACKMLHFIGTWLVVLVAIAAFWRDQPALAWLMPVIGYGFAWVGHFFFQKNRPATFRHPFWSLMGDFAMWKDIMTGKVKF